MTRPFKEYGPCQESRMSDIKNFDIRTYIIDAIVDVFNSMVSMEVEFFDSEPPDTSGTERMAATVNFAGNVGVKTGKNKSDIIIWLTFFNYHI